MIKSISNTSLQEINLHEKLLDRNSNLSNNSNQKNTNVTISIGKIIKNTTIILVLTFLVGYIIFIIISYYN